ncbi:hypothetical protein [Kineosporia sp. A_224]|uniref:hypothetical protein n=1 Tax=Kineosporia sp. A_224 TaxID=1962180 RepID=UPI000B4ABCAD|nr:hypothetical protein [Kineosporia sp. A_224]
MTKSDLPPLSDAELVQLFELLARYASNDLDQWDMWSMKLWWGTAYVDVSNGPLPGASDDHYLQVWPVAPKLLARLEGQDDGDQPT